MRYVLWISLLLLNLGCSTQKAVKHRANTQSRPATSLDEAIKYASQGNHTKAINLYNDILRQSPNDVETILRRGTSFYIVGNTDEAINDFDKAIMINPKFDSEMYFGGGLMAFEKQRYEKASQYFAAYLKNYPEGPKAERVRKMRGDADFRQMYVGKTFEVLPQLMTGINSNQPEYLPLVTLDHQQIIFTRRDRGQEDLYIGYRTASNIWDSVNAISGVNTLGNEAAQTISSDGAMIIFTACDRRNNYGSCDLYQTRLKDGLWTDPLLLNEKVNSPGWESQPSLSADGQRLFFAAKRAEGKGGSDIWMSQKEENGAWGLARNLGSVINTAYDEESPFIHPDGRTLFFRSNGFPSMGSFDIYKTTYDAQFQTWSVPENLGPPINTLGDDGAFSVSPDGLTGYFASDRGKNDLDIYSYQLPEALRPIPVTYIKMRILDASTNKLLPAIVNITSIKDGTTFTYETIPYASGPYPVSSGDDYIITVNKDGYQYFIDKMLLSGKTFGFYPYIAEVKLRPIDEIKKNETYVLNHVYFSSASASLLAESDVEIGQLANTLKSKPNLNIKLVGHTDNIGTTEDNYILSQERADAVKKALIQKGISPSRILSEGKGETEPVASNESPEGRSKNRRTEVVFL